MDMPKKKTKKTMPMQTEEAAIEAELDLLNNESYKDYKKRHARRLEELVYENQFGYKPPKPWYED